MNRLPYNIGAIQKAIMTAQTPGAILELEAKIEAIEQYMRKSGLYDPDAIRPVNEARMWARWQLGRILAAIFRDPKGGRPSKKTVYQVDGFRKLLKTHKLNHQTAFIAQRIATLKESLVHKALAEARDQARFCSFSDLVRLAEPFWQAIRRADKHRSIAREAQAQRREDLLGPFAVIYADPPWLFETYSDKGKGRSPERHYPVLTDEEISNFKVQGNTIREIANDDAVLFLWATPPTLFRAKPIMEAWGFDYRANAVWVKEGIGLGFTFRNRHEHLLVGVRGDMPAAEYKPESVFEYPRREHSEKPPEIRKIIEQMYPAYGKAERLELFARGDVAGWTTFGYEAVVEKAA